MLLRPATPLAVVLFAAFALMLLAVLSTPVIEAIPLGEFDGYTFGVFGFCKDGEGCSSIGIGYDVENLSRDNAFDLPNSVRGSLVSILIVHPVAAFLCLIMFIMAVTSHFHTPSHSARYLLVFFILEVVTFLVCLLSFLVDILVFMPHMAWGTYVVLAATILVAFGGVVTCAMRRSMTSRKARRKKIEENAEMSGENYYNREANKANVDVGIANQPAIPLVSGANQNKTDNLPTFASFEQVKKADQVSDERVPLTARSPTQGLNDASSASARGGAAAAGAYASRSTSRDRYGNPTNGPPDAYGMTRDQSFERSQSRGRGDMGGAYHRGRGGPYGGRGGYGPPGRGRGGYGQPGRGGYGPRGGRGGYGPPPRGAYGPGGPMRGGRSPPPMYAGAGGAYGRRPSNDSYAQEYGSNPSTNPSSAAVNNYDPYNPDANLARAESPPPLPTGPGTMPEMDAAPQGGNNSYGQYGQLRDSDVDVAGMVGLQQGQAPGRHDTYMSEGSKYSTDEQYVPPRQNWNQGSGRNSPAAPSPLHVQTRPSPPAELPGRGTPTGQPPARGYYEDVDPRFAEPSPSHLQNQQQEPLYEDVHAASGSRSPAESERSTFTSISQRGINPRWNPPPPMPGQGLYPPPQQRRPVQQQQQRQDMLLDNPDFQLPGGGGGPGRGPASRGAGGGMIPGSAYPTGSI